MFGTIFGVNALRARRMPRSACSVVSRWFSIRSFLASASFTACPSVSTGEFCADTGAAADESSRPATMTLGMRVLMLAVCSFEGIFAESQTNRRPAVIPPRCHRGHETVKSQPVEDEPAQFGITCTLTVVELPE